MAPLSVLIHSARRFPEQRLTRVEALRGKRPSGGCLCRCDVALTLLPHTCIARARNDDRPGVRIVLRVNSGFLGAWKDRRLRRTFARHHGSSRK